MAQTPDKPKLSTEAIVDAALVLIEEDGLENLSTRVLGKRLGVQAMALYHYVPSKDALLDLVAGRLAGMVEFPPPSDDWRGELEAVARSYVGIAKRHPRAFPLLAMRRYNTADTLPVLQRAFDIYRRAGLPPRAVAAAFRIQGYFMNGAALAEVATLEAARRADFRLPDADFLAGHPTVAETLPHLGPGNLSAIFEKGLAIILDAVADEAAKARKK
jgi:AcrR family transcriptional regulator